MPAKARFDLDRLNRSLERKPVEAILDWAAGNFAGDLALSSSFQTQSVPLLHMLANTAPQVPVLFLDTGYHFPETLAFRDRLVADLGLNLVVLRASAAAVAQTGEQARAPYLADPDGCCHVRKVLPMQQAMQAYAGWISGIRRDQSASRAGAGFVEALDGGHYRIHPMLNWTDARVRAYMQRHDLPAHPLANRGYPSIGCAPCTRPVNDGQSARSGRWAGHAKTECGLHTTLRGVAVASVPRKIA